MWRRRCGFIQDGLLSHPQSMRAHIRLKMIKWSSNSNWTLLGNSGANQGFHNHHQNIKWGNIFWKKKTELELIQSISMLKHSESSYTAACLQHYSNGMGKNLMRLWRSSVHKLLTIYCISLSISKPFSSVNSVQHKHSISIWASGSLHSFVCSIFAQLATPMLAQWAC